MRILMLDNEFPPLGGGTGQINYHLLQGMSQHEGLYIDLVTSSRTRDRYETAQFSPRITIHKVPVDNRIIHHSTMPELLRYGWRGLLFSRRLMARHVYDLSFAFSGVPAGAISYALKVMTGLPYLVALQGPDVPGHEDRYTRIYPLLRPLLRRIWGSAAVVTAQSRGHQEEAHRTMPELDLPIIYNGVDTDAFRPVQGSQARSEVRILTVGRLVEIKGHDYLLRAMAQLRGRTESPTCLTLIGTGDADNALRRLASELGLDGQTDFTGFVPHEDMPALYRESDIFVLPSQNEAMSLALLEAMASGLPVVVTDVGGTAELVQDGINGLVVPRSDVPALAGALETLAKDEPLRRRMGYRSRQIAERFGWSSTTEAYLQLCHRVAARPSPGSPSAAQPPSTRQVDEQV